MRPPSTISNVGVGDLVGVFGTTSGSIVTASQVVIAAPRLTSAFGTAGTVTSAPSAGDFTIKTCGGSTLTVDTSASTTYADFGVSAPSIANVSVGEYVGIFRTSSDSTIAATQVVIAGSTHQGLIGFGRPLHGGPGFGGPGGYRFGGYRFGRGAGSPDGQGTLDVSVHRGPR